MPTLIPCPGCKRTVRVPDGWLDRQVKCPTCGAVFKGGDQPGVVPSRLASEEASLDLLDKPDEPRPSARPRRRERSPDLDDCPYCGETIRKGARECPNCGKELIYDEEDGDADRPRERNELRRDCEPHRGSTIFVMGLVSLIAASLALIFVVCCAPLGFVLCFASMGSGIPAWIMGHGDLKKIKAGTMDPRGRGPTKGGLILGIIGTILGILALLAGAAFIAFIIYNANNGGGMWWRPGGVRRPGR
jgi:endogenous inhibitor of DNA gyrase (YacG/DUF329 family)